MNNNSEKIIWVHKTPAFPMEPTRNEELARKSCAGEELTIGSNGDVKNKEQGRLSIKGDDKLAVDPSKLKTLAKDLREGNDVFVGSSGDVTGKEQGRLSIKGDDKLAVQWYEMNPSVLKVEKEGMKKFFPQFSLHVYDDPSSHYHGCLYWRGKLKPGCLEDLTWDVMALYMPNHPNAEMGSSVHVYLIEPDIRQVKAALGFRPHHLLRDSDGTEYLCTIRSQDISVGNFCTTAVQSIGWAVKWLMSLELVMTGHLSPELFNSSNGI